MTQVEMIQNCTLLNHSCHMYGKNKRIMLVCRLAAIDGINTAPQRRLDFYSNNTNLVQLENTHYN